MPCRATQRKFKGWLPLFLQQIDAEQNGTLLRINTREWPRRFPEIKAPSVCWSVGFPASWHTSCLLQDGHGCFPGRFSGTKGRRKAFVIWGAGFVWEVAKHGPFPGNNRNDTLTKG